MDVGFELIDRVVLIIDDALDQITDRNDANHAATVNDRQMAHAFVRHESQTSLGGLIGFDARHLGFHDVLHKSLRRRSALEYDIPRVVPFGDDANERVAIHDEERADILIGHQLDSRIDRLIRADSNVTAPFHFQQLMNGCHS